LKKEVSSFLNLSFAPEGGKKKTAFRKREGDHVSYIRKPPFRPAWENNPPCQKKGTHKKSSPKLKQEKKRIEEEIDRGS